MNPMWLIRMAKWVRHPPSAGRVWLVLAVGLFCFCLWGVEQLWGWPDWLTPDRVRPR